jgi:hypothetical protein
MNPVAKCSRSSDQPRYWTMHAVILLASPSVRSAPAQIDTKATDLRLTVQALVFRPMYSS